jgi:hypothetical protein
MDEILELEFIICKQIIVRIRIEKSIFFVFYGICGE